ncbi:MAG: serine hydrolase domain-containing protein [Myxococcota bacterium]
MTLLPLLACTHAPRVTEATAAPEVVERLEESVAPLRRRCVDGAAAVVTAGETTWATAWGERPDLTTVHTWGSVSKSLTAVLVMRLVERGALALDTPIAALAPAYATLIPPEKATPPLTLAHLLSHRGGITREEHRREPGMFLWPPGTRWRYSTNGYGVVGDVIEAVSGEPWADAVRRLGEAAGMPTLRASRSAWIAPGALVESDVRDLAAFATKLMDGALVSEASTRTLWSPVVPREATDGWLGDAWDGYGYGFLVAGAGDGLVVAHAGHNGARRAWLSMRPAERRAFVAFCTTHDPTADLDWTARMEAVFAVRE